MFDFDITFVGENNPKVVSALEIYLKDVKVRGWDHTHTLALPNLPWLISDACIFVCSADTVALKPLYANDYRKLCPGQHVFVAYDGDDCPADSYSVTSRKAMKKLVNDIQSSLRK